MPDLHGVRPGRNLGGFVPKYDNYTPLAIPVSQILMAIQKHTPLRWSPAQNIPPPLWPNQEAYCRFHHNFGHTTYNCTGLNDEIERLVQQSDMVEFTRPGPKRPGPKRPLKQEGKRLNINIIISGPVGGDSNRARRTHLSQLRQLQFQVDEWQGKPQTPSITFGSGDKTGIQQSHNDGLVITAMVANYDIARILVDTGSSVDIIFFECFNQIKLGLEIKPVDTCLVGFSGADLILMGEVTMPLSLGSFQVRKLQSNQVSTNKLSHNVQNDIKWTINEFVPSYGVNFSYEIKIPGGQSGWGSRRRAVLNPTLSQKGPQTAGTDRRGR